VYTALSKKNEEEKGGKEKAITMKEVLEESNAARRTRRVEKEEKKRKPKKSILRKEGRARQILFNGEGPIFKTQEKGEDQSRKCEGAISARRSIATDMDRSHTTKKIRWKEKNVHKGERGGKPTLLLGARHTKNLKKEHIREEFSRRKKDRASSGKMERHEWGRRALKISESLP